MIKNINPVNLAHERPQHAHQTENYSMLKLVGF